MKTVLWILQILLALFFGMAAVSQLFNYGALAQSYEIYRVLQQAFWVVYAVLALVCSLGLVITKIAPRATPVAATVLAIQGIVFAALYARYAGFQPSLAVWAAWTLGPVVIAAYVAYARTALKHRLEFGPLP